MWYLCIFSFNILGGNEHADNPPVSRIVVRSVSPKSTPFTLTPSRLVSQNPTGLMLGRLTKVFGSNLAGSRALERKKRSNHVGWCNEGPDEPKGNLSVIVVVLYTAKSIRDNGG